ncbi:MAG: leucine-rich repeat domain-containing protein [Candidatus Izemoplasmatales bacterium]|jgi:hypothetical protein
MKKKKIILLLALVSLLFGACQKTPTSDSSKRSTTSEFTSTYSITSTYSSERPTTSDPSSHTTSKDPVTGYKITWLNWNGAHLMTHYNYPVGEMPVFNDTPVRPEDDDYTYEFDGWTPDLVPVVADATYYAKYIPHPKTAFVDPYDFAWGENEEGIVLIGYYGNAPVIEIPALVDEKPVVALQKWAFFDNVTLREVTIPDSVINIGEDAFASCINLHTVNFGNNVESIGFDAFSNCVSLESIILPDSVKKIGPEAFSECPNLVNLHIPSKVENVDSSLVKKSSVEAVTVYEKGIYVGNSENPYLVLIGVDASFSAEHLSVHTDTKIIADDAFFGSNLTGVTLGKNVHTIGDSAFARCSGLTAVELPNSLRHLGMGAFENCDQLGTVKFGNQLETIGSQAFYNCKSLTNIVLPESLTSIGSYAFYSWPDNIVYTEHDNGRYLGTATNKHFALIKTNSEYITSISIHADTHIVADGAFSSCTKLTGVTIPAGVAYLGDSLFYNCFALTSLSVENGNTKYSSPTNNKAIMETATDKLLFGLKDGYIPEGTKILGDSCFAYFNLKESAIAIPNSVVELEAGVFYNSSLPSTFTIPNSVTKIGNGAFQYCSNMQLLTLSNQIKIINPWTFSGCDDLTSVTIPDSVTIIGEYAFNGCDGLVTVNFGSNVSLIADAAFSGCAKLGNPQLNNNLRVIHGGAFSGCSLITSIEFGEYLIHLSGSAFIEAPITSISVHADNQYFDSRTDCNAVVSKKSNILVMGCVNSTIDPTVVGIGPYAFASTAITNITLPANVVTLGAGAFNDCRFLTSITIQGEVTAIPENCFLYCTELKNFVIPSSVTSLGNNAFGDCPFTTIEIPSTVTSIGAYCFSYCESLTEIVIPSSVTSLSNGVFYGCSALSKITLPEELTSIGNYTFSNCSNLNSIVIPSTVTTIGQRAFNSCANLSIFAMASELPSGWGSTWNPANCPVYWYSETPNYDGSHWRYVEGIPTVWHN